MSESKIKETIMSSGNIEIDLNANKDRIKAEELKERMFNVIKQHVLPILAEGIQYGLEVRFELGNNSLNKPDIRSIAVVKHLA